MTGIKWQIWEAKCPLYKQIQNLEDSAISIKVCQEAYQKFWSGFHQEFANICHEVRIYDMNKFHVKKTKIGEAIFKSSALLADAFYKSICPYVCLSDCVAVDF